MADQKTFVVMLEDLSSAVICSLLTQRGWKEVSLDAAENMPAGPDLVIVDGKYNWDRRMYDLPCRLKGRLSAKVLTNKGCLHAMLGQHAPDLIAKTYHITNKSKWPEGLPEGWPWIVRPVNGFEGRGVVVVTGGRQLQQVQQYADWKQALLSRYITTPMLLFNGRKFHMRIYYLVVATPTGKRTAVYNRGKIIHAADPYVAGDYKNKRIHDTHRRWSTPCFFPDNYPGDASAVFKEIVKTLTRVSELALPQITWYDEATAGGFEIYGCDFMVEHSGQLVLIEINHKAKFKCASDPQEQVDALSNMLFGGLVEFVVENRTLPQDLQFVTPLVRHPTQTDACAE